MLLFRTFTNEKKITLSHKLCHSQCVILLSISYILSVLFAEKVKQHSNTPKLTHYHCQMSKDSDWLQDTISIRMMEKSLTEAGTIETKSGQRDNVFTLLGYGQGRKYTPPPPNFENCPVSSH